MEEETHLPNYLFMGYVSFWEGEHLKPLMPSGNPQLPVLFVRPFLGKTQTKAAVFPTFFQGCHVYLVIPLGPWTLAFTSGGDHITGGHRTHQFDDSELGAVENHRLDVAKPPANNRMHPQELPKCPLKGTIFIKKIIFQPFFVLGICLIFQGGNLPTCINWLAGFLSTRV